MNKMQWLDLIEFKPERFRPQEIETSVGEHLWRHYSKQVTVDFPSPKTKGQWQLTAQGWVGFIPINADLGIHLLPKVPLGNLFWMLEYAYRLKSFYFLKGLTNCDTLQEFYEQLANVLALNILERGRRGYYREYNNRSEQLSYISGSMDINQLVSRNWDVNIKCHFQEHMSDIEDNQILTWTLYKISSSGLCTERVLPNIRKAYRNILGHTSLVLCSANDCLGRLYNRLNMDYQPMHALCRFFLDQTGPSHAFGDYSMMPFLINMARLYELFIAEWLKDNLPPGFEIKAQEKVDIDEDGYVSFAIDLVLYDKVNNIVRCVLDTKYKTNQTPLPADVSQVATYAIAKNCKDAILVYPTSNILAYDQFIGESDIRVQSIGFDLNDDIEAAGQVFLRQLLAEG